MTLWELHRTHAWVVIIANAVVGVWALSAHFWPPLRGGKAIWGGVIIAETTVVVQVILGISVAVKPEFPLSWMHAMYGILATISIAVLFGYQSRPFIGGRRLVLYGVGSLFIMGLAIRGYLVH